jgi:hypothetical protein
MLYCRENAAGSSYSDAHYDTAQGGVGLARAAQITALSQEGRNDDSAHDEEIADPETQTRPWRARRSGRAGKTSDLTVLFFPKF